MSEPTDRRSVLLGRSISRGVGHGLAIVDDSIIPAIEEPVRPGEAARQIEELDRARQLVSEHLDDHVRGAHSPAEEDLSAVLEAHLMVLRDEGFFRDIERRIRGDRLPAERAVREAFSSAAARLGASNDAYMRSRAEDLRDICQNLRRALVFGADAFLSRVPEGAPVVMVAPHLHPSTVLRARRLGATGFVTSSTAYTSHAAILLRAAAIPAVAGVPLGAGSLRDGTPIVVDAERGEVVVNPSRAELAAIEVAATASVEEHVSPPLDATLPNGESVALHANIDHVTQAPQCLRHRLDGVGLFRSELLVLERGTVPDEEEQLAAYRQLVDAVDGRSVVIRTFDFGADKEPTGLNECVGHNPALGLRGLRRHLHRKPEEFRTQLRAILRAAADADVSVLLPMVTHASEIRAARQQLQQAAAELEAEGHVFGTVKVGAMIEVPSAALMIRQLLEESDFLSIGTNDLVQYLAAADRENPALIDYQEAARSGLYELLEHVMTVSRDMNRTADLSVCGELASVPEGARALTRIGFRSLSITPATADSIRRAISTPAT